MPPRVASLPQVAPIIPILRSDPFDDPEWLFEPKFDGFRGTLYLDGNSATFVSKQRKELARFARLARRSETSSRSGARFWTARSWPSTTTTARTFAASCLTGAIRTTQVRPALAQRQGPPATAADQAPPAARAAHSLHQPDPVQDHGRFRRRQGAVRCGPATGHGRHRRQARLHTYDAKSVWFKVKNRPYFQQENRFERLSRNDLHGL